MINKYFSLGLFIIITPFLFFSFSFVGGAASTSSTYETHIPIVKEGVLYYKKVNNQSLIYLKEDSGKTYWISNIPEWSFFNNNIGNRMRIAGFTVNNSTTNNIVGIRATGPAGVLSYHNTLRYEGDTSQVIKENVISRHLANLPSQLSTSGFPFQYQVLFFTFLLFAFYLYNFVFKRRV